MNLTTLKAASNVAASLWNRFSEYRAEKAREAYEALETAAEKVNSSDLDLFPASRREAGSLTRAAHTRLDKAKQDLAAATEAARAEATVKSGEAMDKSSALRDLAKDRYAGVRAATKRELKEAQKRAEQRAKEAQKAAKKAARKDKRQKQAKKSLSVAGIIALLAAVIGGIYVYLTKFRNNDTAYDTPPRVDDFADADAATESTLVYTSSTEDDLLERQAASDPNYPDTRADQEPISDMVEEPVTERDEELLGSIDEQLAAHQTDSDHAPKHALNDDEDDQGRNN